MTQNRSISWLSTKKSKPNINQVNCNNSSYVCAHYYHCFSTEYHRTGVTIFLSMLRCCLLEGKGKLAITQRMHSNKEHTKTSTQKHVHQTQFFVCIRFCYKNTTKTTTTTTRPFNGPLSGTTQDSQYQKGKTNLE